MFRKNPISQCTPQCFLSTGFKEVCQSRISNTFKKNPFINKLNFADEYLNRFLADQKTGFWN